MKHFLIILSLFLTPILGITACNPGKKSDDQVQKEKDDKEDENQKEKDDKEQIEKENNNKWQEFSGRINRIIKSEFKVANQVKRILEINDCQNCTNTSEKLDQYKNLENTFRQLPKINNNSFINQINKIFKTMQFWIIYLNGDDKDYNFESYKKNGNKAERKLSDIFDGLDSKRLITIKNKDINNAFGNWNFAKDSIETEIRLLEFIEYHWYIERSYQNILKNYKEHQEYAEKINEKTFYAQLIFSDKDISKYFSREVINIVGAARVNDSIWFEVNKSL